MKKNLLLAVALVTGASIIAQNDKKAFNFLKPVFVKEKPIIDPDVPFSGKLKTTPVSPRSSAICMPERVTSCVNAFAVAGGITTYMQNVLSYNKDLNAVVLTSRMSADWPIGGTGLTNTGAGAGTYGGSIQCTFLDVTPHIWDSTVIYRDSAGTKRGRFPGGTFFNPTGNTTLGGAFVAGAGSVTDGSNWQGEWYSTRSLAGGPSVYHKITSAQEHKSFSATGTAPFGNVGNSTSNVGFLNVDMQQHGSQVWSMGALFDKTSGDVTGTVIGKGTYSGGTFTWSADSSLKPAFYNSASNGLQNDAEGARIAFDPSGNIGYAVFNGRLAATYANSADEMMMPIVYKTTDSGATWTLVLDGYDWATGHPELMKNVGTLSVPYRPTGYSATRFTPYLRHGIDLTVDALGTLHYVTTFVDPYLNGSSPDSLQYSYTYNWDYNYHHPVIWDLMTDGTCWKTMMVDSIITSYVGGDPASDTTASFSAWTSPTGAPFLAYGAHLTVSRSSDGTMVFYGWGDSDPSVTGTQFNQQPDMIMKGYDVISRKVSATNNVTSGIGQCFFSYLSDVSYYDTGNSSWVVPFVYIVGRTISSPGVYAGGMPVDFYYGNSTCGSFNAASFTTTAMVNQDQITPACAVGIKNNTHFVTPVINYPNPFSGTTEVLVTLNEAKTLDLKVYDIMGNLVFAKKARGNMGENRILFDGSALSAGVYHYTLTAGYEKITNKMVIQ